MVLVPVWYACNRLPLAQQACSGVTSPPLYHTGPYHAWGNVLIRHHRTLRLKTFSPNNVQGMPINLDELEPLRKTIVMDSHGRILQTQVDEWATGSTRFRGESWVGQTRFFLKTRSDSKHKPLTEEEIASETIDQDLIKDIPLPVNPRRSGTIINEDVSDFWEHKGRFWIRHHLRPRSALFVPQEHQPGGPDPHSLSNVRESRFCFIKDKPINIEQEVTDVRYDNWRSVPHFETVSEWVGLTIFKALGDYPDHVQDHEPSQDAETAQGLKTPKEPSPNERALHELTHLPYASWCQSCVEGKGKSDRHVTSRSSLPVIQIDYAFPQFTLQGGDVVLLTAIDTLTGMVMACQLPSKAV